MRARIDEAHLAFVFLLRVPLPRLREPVPTMARAAWAWPLAGIPVGLAAWALHAGALAVSLPPLAGAFLAIGGALMLTGGLHADGLADLFDGLWGGHDRARRLEIMRDSRIGAYGVMALIVTLGLLATAIAAAEAGPLAFVGAAMLSRALMVPLAAMPPARAEGLGHGAAGPDAPRIAVALLLGLLPLAAHPGAALAGILAAAAVAATARAKIGGQTGDVLGAAQMLSACAIWLAIAA